MNIFGKVNIILDGTGLSKKEDSSIFVFFGMFIFFKDLHLANDHSPINSNVSGYFTV